MKKGLKLVEDTKPGAFLSKNLNMKTFDASLHPNYLCHRNPATSEP